MMSCEEHPTTRSRAGHCSLIAFFMLLPHLVLIAHIMVAVRQVDRKPTPDLESRALVVWPGEIQVLPEYADVQHDAPPPCREIEECESGVGVVVVDVDDDYEGDVNVGWL
jgi:hypothetical protein